MKKLQPPNRFDSEAILSISQIFWAPFLHPSQSPKLSMFQYERKMGCFAIQTILGKRQEAIDYWRKSPRLLRGKATERKSLYLAHGAAQVKSKEKYSLLTPPALHHCWGSLQPPRIRSSGLSPAAQCCCGIGNLLWLRKIMGICFSKPKKSQTKFRREKKKYKNSWSYWRSSWHLPTYATIFFGISWFCDQKNYHIMFIIVVFFRVAGGEGWYREGKHCRSCGE